MILRLIAVGVVAGLFLALPVRAPAADEAPVKTGQHAHTFAYKGDNPASLDYQLFLPADYGKDAAKKWPVILFLHGSGERGSDIEKVKLHGPPKIVEKKPDFPFIVISPQCPAEQRGWEPEALSALVKDVLSHYKTDPDRVYLTGLSMGGFGTWSLAARHPEQFAAIAPVCGGGDPSTAERLKNLPTWVFHGEEDKSVPIQRSELMVDAMKKAGADDVQFTRYPKTGHDCWTATYDNPKLYQWFLSHKRTTTDKHG